MEGVFKVSSEYLVTWDINISGARDPIDAARQALEIQRDPESIATVFQVIACDSKDKTRIDLSVVGETEGD